ncbi:hypothetical protein P2H44_05640 [Albimonas sp. CAU 1670]|uniref:hypothetical protein n=1 Tax=Albimonas sp. CAU 1670 TaxID=3032599 RepID=UPI0023D9FDC1|nr:hypothetical protein [Albimonas sp. CAU 1670]MDF2232029.1 hypothetical protein [Albimonas sp. CAU 1670]
MSLRTKRKELHGLVGALGVAVLLGGLLGTLYPATFALFAAVSIWIVGTTLVNVFTDKS